jgi:serine protease Do
MNRKDLFLPALVAVLVSGATTAGTQMALAAESRPVNPAPVAPSGAPASFADVVARVAPAVVSVDVEQQSRRRSTEFGAPGRQPFDDGDGGNPFEQFRRFFQGPGLPPPGPVRGTGSGFFISGDGYIVTNNHVVAGADKVTVRTADDRTLPARVIGRDPATDLAVIKVEGRDFPFVSFEDRAKPRVGDWVVAMGNPFNLGGTATAGIVSALARPNVSGSGYVDFMQIDAPINRGNSGGPTFDLYGRVVGVNTAIFSPSGGSVGIGFDIPADVAADVSRQLIANGKVTRGYIGASVQNVTREIAESLGVAARGALVAEVVPGGPSDRAGLKPGDLVLSINGQEVTNAAGLTRAVAQVAPGQELRLAVRRGDRTERIVVRAALRPSEQALADNPSEPGAGGGAEAAGLGVAVSPNPGGGVRIESVDPASGAAQRGLRPGDVIKRIGSRPANTAADLSSAVAQAKSAGRRQVLLLVARGGREIFVPVDVGRGEG